jgi:hypothetical protein
MVAPANDVPPEMTIDEQHRALQRLFDLRRKPVVVAVGGSTLGSGLIQLVGDANAGVAHSEAVHGERERYVEFRRRWGPKFKGSIIGRSRTAWQMHVCRLPVFPYERSEKGRKIVPAHLLRTADAAVVVKWFRGLSAAQRWELCVESRAARTSDQNSRRNFLSPRDNHRP